MKPFPSYRTAAILYTLFIFSLGIFALPLANLLFGGDSIYHRLFPLLCLLFAAILLVLLWKNRKQMTPLKWMAMALMISVYALFYYNLDVRLEEIHLINFAVLAILFKKAFESSRHPGQAYWKAIALAMLVGGLDEWIQLFIPGRFAQWHDVGLCFLGAALGTLLCWIFRAPSSLQR